MSEKRRGLGKGLGALIPTAPTDGRPVDVFFPTQERAARDDTPTQRDQSAGRSAATSKAAPSRSTAKGPAGSGTATATKQGSGTARTRTASKRAKIPADTLGPRQRAGRSATAAGTPVAPDTANGASPDAGSTHDTQAGQDAHVTQDAPAAQDAPSTDNAPSGPLVSVPGATFAEVPVDEVVPNRRQPRQVFDEDDLDELAASIREVGVLQPIVVRELPETEEARYELIMGERRWRASQLAGNATVPAIIKEVDDTDLLRDALLENLHRAQLNPLEEAAAYQQLLDDFDCTHEELAARIVRSRPQISNTLRLLKLPPLVQRRLAAGVLSAGHARALLGLSDPAAMERLAQRIVAEGLSVRTTEEIVALGDEPIAPEMRRRPRTEAHTAELEQLATRLADRFDTRVKIGMGQRKGKINIEFASLEDLNRILEVLAPNVEGVPGQ